MGMEQAFNLAKVYQRPSPCGELQQAFHNLAHDMEVTALAELTIGMDKYTSHKLFLVEFCHQKYASSHHMGYENLLKPIAVALPTSPLRFLTWFLFILDILGNGSHHLQFLLLS